ncbi:MAG: glycosyltransferase family 2 protein [Chlorobi bacterium]|nr:glycosyltransferase family 2 protein [Chlorobiota bacterium]
MSLLDVVIIHHNTLELTHRCLDSIYQTRWEGIASVTVVDNASTDGSRKALAARYPTTRFIRLEEPHGYAAACNIGARSGSAPFVLLSNSDVEYTHASFDKCVAQLQSDPRIAVCTPRQVYPDGRPQRSWGYFPGWQEIIAIACGIEMLHNRRGHSQHSVRAVPYCDGAALFCRRDAYEAIGGMDERFAFFCEDVDLCYRFWIHGWHCHFVPTATIVHHRGATRRSDVAKTLAYEAANFHAKLRFVSHHQQRARESVRLGYMVVFRWRKLILRLLRALGILEDTDDARQAAIERGLFTTVASTNERT